MGGTRLREALAVALSVALPLFVAKGVGDARDEAVGD